MAMTITKLHDHVGAEIGGVDLSRPLDEATFAAIEEAFYQSSVLVVRRQDLPPERQIAFSQRFGPLEVHILDQYQLAGHPEILLLSNKTDADGKPLGLVEAGRYWHTDVSFTEVPSMGSFLYAVEIPPAGGDTLFASQFAAYDALPQDWKERLAGLKALHGLNKTTAPKFTDAQLASVKGVEHPLIRTHPKTGRKALYAGTFALRVLDVSEAESDEILAFLRDHWAQDDIVYRHRWQANDLVMWDNRSVLHCATLFDARFIRHMHRTTVAGEKPV
ncbi:MAG: TauD/TfdA family dioxygenase [Proteobacteria bacterium]|nr:TauD/TfdA family dioxygenase [Pseudomonadota bacterium]MDA1057981.1 TauD/TfdA family dioxygenase [Pseudomonadota bacterium]